MGDVNETIARIYYEWGYQTYIDFGSESTSFLQMLAAANLSGSPSAPLPGPLHSPDAGAEVYFTDAAPIEAVRNASNLFAWFLEDEPDGRTERCARDGAQVLTDVQRAATVCNVLAPRIPTMVTISESALHQEDPPLEPPVRKMLFAPLVDVLIGHEYCFGGGDRDCDVWSRRLVMDLQAAARPRPSAYILEVSAAPLHLLWKPKMLLYVRATRPRATSVWRRRVPRPTRRRHALLQAAARGMRTPRAARSSAVLSRRPRPNSSCTLCSVQA